MSIRFTVMDDNDGGVYRLDTYVRRSSSVIFEPPLEGAVVLTLALLHRVTETEECCTDGYERGQFWSLLVSLRGNLASGSWLVGSCSGSVMREHSTKLVLEV